MNNELVLEILKMAMNSNQEAAPVCSRFGMDFIGQTVIIRTYSAGVWCGTLKAKDKTEVILSNARRMWKWWAAESVSLSAVVKYGINQDKSKIAPPVESVWLEAIEIMPISGRQAESIMDAKEVPQS